jgi:hypothetical protein
MIPYLCLLYNWGHRHTTTPGLLCNVNKVGEVCSLEHGFSSVPGSLAIGWVPTHGNMGSHGPEFLSGSEDLMINSNRVLMAVSGMYPISTSLIII